MIIFILSWLHFFIFFFPCPYFGNGCPYFMCIYIHSCISYLTKHSRLFTFHFGPPGAFWASVCSNFVLHGSLLALKLPQKNSEKNYYTNKYLIQVLVVEATGLYIKKNTFTVLIRRKLNASGKALQLQLISQARDKLKHLNWPGEQMNIWCLRVCEHNVAICDVNIPLVCLNMWLIPVFF